MLWRLKVIATCLVTLGISLPNIARAETQINIQARKVGSQGGSGYITFDPQYVSGCNYQNIYFDLSSDAGKAYFATALSAYLAGKPISRIDYSVANGNCTATLIEI